MKGEIVIRSFIIGITGATGSIYGFRLIEELLSRGHEVYVTITDAGKKVINYELSLDLEGVNVKDKILNYFREQANVDKIPEEKFNYYPIDEIDGSIASGSFTTDGLIVTPCSMSTLSGIAHGRSMNLLERAADVILKENKDLIIVPREMPLNAIQIENMLKLSRLGVTVLPPMPGFYHQPETIDDLINHVIGKILDSLNIENDLYKRWE